MAPAQPARSPHWLKPQFGTIPYAPWEWVVMRILFAYFCLHHSIPVNLDITIQPAPNGIAQFVDLTFLSTPAAHTALSWLLPILLGLYVLGLAPFAVTTALFALHVASSTLINSQGAIHHTGHVIGYALLGQVLFLSYRWIRHLTGKESLAQSKSHLHRDLIYGTQQALVAAYVIAGLSKIIKSGWEWVATVPNMVLQIEKNAGMRFHDTLAEPASRGSEFGILFITNYPALTQVLLVAGLLLELFAFLALWNRAALAFFGAALISMHMFISSAMQLGFAYNKAALAIFFVNVPFWIILAARRFAKPKPDPAPAPAL